MGAPRGNTNALKHGLYAKHISPEEQAGLRSLAPEDFHNEINLMRVAVGRLFGIQALLHAMVEDHLRTGQPCDVDALANISNSLSLAITALNTTARTHVLFKGADKSMNDAYEIALNSLTIFIDDKYRIESLADKEDQQDILIE